MLYTSNQYDITNQLNLHKNINKSFMKSYNTSPGWEASGRPSRTGSFPSPLRSVPGGSCGCKGLSQAGGRCTDGYMWGRTIVTPVNLFAKPEELSSRTVGRREGFPGTVAPRATPGLASWTMPSRGAARLTRCKPGGRSRNGEGDEALASGSEFQRTPKTSAMEVNTFNAVL